MSGKRVISDLLRSVRAQSGLSLEQLSETSGLAANELRDIEDGRVDNFGSILMCRKAVFAYAQSLNIEQQVKELWVDADWVRDADALGQYPLSVESKVPPLFAAAKETRKFKLPPRVYGLGLIGLYTVVVGAALWRLSISDSPPEESAAPVSATVASEQTEGGQREAGAVDAAQARAERDRLPVERTAAEKATTDRTVAEREQLRTQLAALEKTIAAEKAAREKALAERAAAEKAITDRAAAERAAAEKAITDRAAAERTKVEAALAKAERDRAAKEAEFGRLAAEREQLRTQLAALERTVAAEKAAREKVVAERAVAEKALMDRATAERVAAEKAAREKALADRAAAEKAITDRAVAERIAAERAAAERVAAAERLATASRPAVGSLVAGRPPAEDKAVISSDALRREVEKRVADFASLWSAKRVDPYLALFDKSFPDYANFIALRRQRMSAASFIEVSIDDATFRSTGPNEITARFNQRYRSDTYQSRETKEQVWRQTPDGPKIVLERKLN